MVNKRVLVASLVLVLLVFGFVDFTFLHLFKSSSSDITGNVIDTTGIINIDVDLPPGIITIHTPQNAVYNSTDYVCSGEGYPKCDDFRYILPLNVTADFTVDPIEGWKYSLYDLGHGIYIEENVAFTPNTTINAVGGENKLYVFAKEEDGEWITESVVFTVEVPNSAPIIGPIDDEVYVCETNALDERFNATDIDEEILTYFIIPTNPFYLDYLGMEGLNTSLYSIISGILTKDELGVYPEVISVVDTKGLSDSSNLNITVIEINNPPVAENIGAQTVWTRGENSTFHAYMNVTDVEDGVSSDENMTFNISWDNNEDLFDINVSTGEMNYTPIDGQQGAGSLTYGLTICVEDNPLENPHENISVCFPKSNESQNACDSFTITVTDENRAPEITNYTPETPFNMSGTSTAIFTATVFDKDGTIPDIDWYVSDTLFKHNESISSAGFSHTFGCGVSGVYEITVITTDGLLNDSQTWEIDVINVKCPDPPSSGGGGGGGGGGSFGGFCREKWVCDNWDVCQNVARSFAAKMLSLEDFSSTREICAQNGYEGIECGYQITTCRDLNNCNNTIPKEVKPEEFRVCYFTENPACTDGIKNCHDGSCELLIDCGGPCAACASCSDGMQNQGEFGIDCGGPCPYACEAEIPARISRFIVIGLSILLLILLIFIIIKIIKILRYRVAKAKEAIITINSFTKNLRGIKGLTYAGTKVQISGHDAEEVKRKVENNGNAKIKIQYLSKSDKGKFRFPSYKGLA